MSNAILAMNTGITKRAAPSVKSGKSSSATRTGPRARTPGRAGSVALRQSGAPCTRRRHTVTLSVINSRSLNCSDLHRRTSPTWGAPALPKRRIWHAYVWFLVLCRRGVCGCGGFGSFHETSGGRGDCHPPWSASLGNAQETTRVYSRAVWSVR